MKLISLIALIVAISLAVAQENDNNSTTAIAFDKVLIVVLENQPLKASMRNSKMRDILHKGTLLTQYYALTNPSQPNYIGMIAGDMFGVTGDGVYNIAENNLVDLLEEKNVTWKSYQEDYPGNCFAGDTSNGLYKRKHNPFISFDNIRENPQRCANIVQAPELLKDLKAGNVPQYSFYTPNMNNNGHDTGLSYTASWLHDTFLPTYLDLFNTGNSLLVITFDEGVRGDNQIYTLLIGSMIPQGNIDSTRYTHYSLLRLIEENFGLGSLNRGDVGAERITSKAFVKGTLAYYDERLALALGIGLPLVVLSIVGVVAYAIYRRRMRQQRARMYMRTSAEMNELLANYDDNTV